MSRRPVILLGACVLVPMPLADTLLRLAEPPALFEARWTNDILAEVTRTLVRRFGKSPEKARYREAAMRKFFPDSLVEGYQPLIDKLENNPKDRHVLAAAIVCQAEYLVTFNLKHFPAKAVIKYGLTVIGPSTFLRQLWNLNQSVVAKRSEEQVAAIGISRDNLLEHLARAVPAFLKTLRTESD
jgi:predicted nucleic acid-binding protein